MRFQSAGAFASLLLFSRVAVGAALAERANATLPIEDDDTCDPDLEETVTATVLPISSAAAVPTPTGVASNAESAPAPIANGTLPTSAQEQLTTLTVLSTQVRTVISCAPTVTNCPADSSSLSNLASTAPDQVSTVLVTDVVQLATTICPVTAAESVSSSVISVAATGGITGTTITQSASLPGSLPTDAAPSPSGTGAGAGPQPSGEAAASSAISADIPSESAAVPPESAAEIPSGSAIPPQESSSPETGASPAPPAPTGAVPQPPSNSTGVRPFPIGNSSIASVQEVTSTVSVATEIVPVSTTVLTTTLASSELASLSSVAAITGAPETTPTPGGEQTTLTVQVTHLHTVISCAPTVTNCPAATATKEISEAISSHGSSAVQPVIVTSIVGETTTVCPVAEASSISSEVGASLSSAVVTTTVGGSASFFIPGASSVQTAVASQATPVVSFLTVSLGNGVESTSTKIAEQPQTVTNTIPLASASSSVEAVAGSSSSTAVIVSVSPVVSVITITLSDGFERTSTSSLQVASTITTVVAVPTTPAAETPVAETSAQETVHTTVLSTSIVQVPSVVTVTVSGIAQESSTVIESTSVHTSIVEPSPSAPASQVVSNLVSTIYETVTSQIPVETILTVTLGDQVLTSTISTAAAVQTAENPAPPQVSTVYVTVGSGSETSIMTSTFTASEVVAKETQTLTLTGSAGIVSTYTLTMSQATTVTQEAPKPTNQGNVASACVPSTVTLVSVSTLCARSGNACATATNLPLARF
ncbi:hypothetical protein FJTKL_01028 [Diaporthe vaccinii]|uniref:Uncharacterized protein n=1 Tax=Diaporthe vaccinii TaxID=105482 RepID=A0ABR4E1H5_9PEZI